MAIPSKLILAVGGVAALAAAGWFGYQQFFEDAAAPAPVPVKRTAQAPAAHAKPKAGALAASATASTDHAQQQAPADPDVLIERVLIATGLNHQINVLPKQFMEGAREAAGMHPGVPPAFTREVDRILAEEFTAQRFQKAVREGLKARFDQKKLDEVLAAADTPVGKKMVGYESAEMSSPAMQTYVKGLAAHAPSAERRQLIEALDEASGGSRLSTEIAFASARAMAVSAASNPGIAAEVDRKLESQRPRIAAAVREGTLLGLAYTYRDASDAELGEYLKLQQSEASKWYMGVVSEALAGEFTTASTQVGVKMAAVIKSMTSQRVAAVPGQGSGAVAAEEPAPARGGGAPMLAMAHGAGARDKDLRGCLELPTTEQIIRCSEQGL